MNIKDKVEALRMSHTDTEIIDILIESYNKAFQLIQYLLAKEPGVVYSDEVSSMSEAGKELVKAAVRKGSVIIKDREEDEE